eukprot:7391847-Prymnesium_polylepis.5
MPGQQPCTETTDAAAARCLGRAAVPVQARQCAELCSHWHIAEGIESRILAEGHPGPDYQWLTCSSRPTDNVRARRLVEASCIVPASLWPKPLLLPRKSAPRAHFACPRLC